MSGQPMNVNMYRSERYTRGIVYAGMETTCTEFTSVMTFRRTETITPSGPQAGLNSSTMEFGFSPAPVHPVRCSR